MLLLCLFRDHGSRGVKEEEVAMDTDTPQEKVVDLKDDDTESVETALERTRRLLRRGQGEAHGAAKVASMLTSVPQVMVKQEPRCA